jgi:hypothetical protein
MATEQRRPSMLDRAANVAIVVTCLVFCIYVGKSLVARPPGINSSSELPAIYKAGDKIANAPGLRFDKNNLTLVLATASTCHYCTESMEFYGKLLHAAQAKGVRVANVSLEDPDRNRQYFLSHGIAIDMPAPMGDTGLRVRGTPTLLLVRADGTVVGAWVGKLGEPMEREVLKAIGSS